MHPVHFSWSLHNEVEGSENENDDEKMDTEQKEKLAFLVCVRWAGMKPMMVAGSSESDAGQFSIRCAVRTKYNLRIIIFSL